jgi:hypothetical protein
MKLTKKHLMQIADEARKTYVSIPNNIYLFGDIDTKNLSESERLTLCYLQGCLLTLNANQVLCSDWESKLEISILSQDSEPETD